MAATAAASSRTATDRRGLFYPPAGLAIAATDVHPDTMCGVHLRQVERYGARASIYVKRGDDWLPISWVEILDSVTAVGAALIRQGITAGDRVAILSENRLEWMCLDFGAQLAGAAVVPVYASSSPDSIAQILGDCGAALIVCSTPKQAAKLAEIGDVLPALRVRVLMEGETPGFVALHDIVDVATVNDVRTLEDRARDVRPEHTVTIIYTSGTTGVPKGVLLSHANVVGSCRAALQVVHMYDTDHGISFLPWAHVYERVQGMFAGMVAGVAASIANDLDHIGEDLRAVRPTAMNGVPRIYEKMQEAIMAQVRSAGGRRAALGIRAIDEATQMARLRRHGERVPIGLRLRCVLWQRLVLDRIRAGLGGRARVFSSGGGPINLATLEFFDALGIGITEGYGLTETSGGVTANDPEAPRFGTVGRATPGHEIRIAEDGEILVRGPGVMQGYFNNPAATAEVLHDGWFATGDIGELDAEGYLRITDRKKDLIVTAGGKNIAPQPIEASIMHDPMVERATIIGDRRKYLVALIVPDFGALRDWARENGITASSDAELVRDPRVVELYTAIGERASARLARYETVTKVAVLDRDLTEERGELTPSLKVKRNVVARNFAEVIDALYA